MRTALTYMEDDYTVVVYPSRQDLVIKFSVDGAVITLSVHHTDFHIRFTDLWGYAEFPELRRKGIGTFLVNIALQYLDSMYPPNYQIEGTMSGVEDLHEPAQMEKRAKIRKRFWNSFGKVEMEKVGVGDGYIYFHTTLGEFRPKREGVMLNGSRRYVHLSEFNKVEIDE